MPIEPVDDPLDLFRLWFSEAEECDAIADPTAVVLATADGSGLPSARVVLLKGWTEEGFVFYTNARSRKGDELRVNPQASLCIYWMPIDKQVRIQGTVSEVAEAEADAYFASRPRESQLGAWASDQSQPLDARATLEKRFKELESRYNGKEVPRPPHWKGYRVAPSRIEFWMKQAHRLHDRLNYVRDGGGWRHELLYP